MPIIAMSMQARELQPSYFHDDTPGYLYGLIVASAFIENTRNSCSTA
jgi:hypothetical protein